MIRKMLIGLVIFASAGILKAQDYSSLEKIEMKSKEEFAKNEDKVKECAEFILKSPVTTLEKESDQTNALKFIMRWMEGTPDYMFNMDESIGGIIQSNAALLGVYLACMSKYVLTNKENADDEGKVEYNSFLLLIKYCEDPSNKVEQTKEIKELIKAKEDNKLKEFLNIKPSGQLV